MDGAKIILSLFLLGSLSANADATLKKLFAKTYKDKKERTIIKEYALKKTGEAVPTLIEVMKTSSYPDDNRWLATFLLGQIMGKKSAPFVAKFLKHPKWFMRLASLKTLLLLKEGSYKGLYASALKDPSLIVRAQALDTITELGLSDLGPSVWNMLYDESNYAGSKKTLKRTQMIRDVILAVGYLKFQEAKPALLKMATNRKYGDIFKEVDHTLVRLTGKKSPKHIGAKQIFWQKYAVSEQTIL